MKIYFATSNPWKYREIKEKFNNAGLDLGRINTQLLELQDVTNEEVALISARDAFKKFKKPLFVEDSGIYIKALKGFPGLYSSFIFKAIGLKGILKLMENKKNRQAEFISVIVYKDSKQEKVFKGICRGSITNKIRGRGGFGFDPIFVPKGYNTTFAENYAIKEKISHRVKSVNKLIKWLKNGKQKQKSKRSK